jgi:hypothetical protein
MDGRNKARHRGSGRDSAPAQLVSNLVLRDHQGLCEALSALDKTRHREDLDHRAGASPFGAEDLGYELVANQGESYEDGPARRRCRSDVVARAKISEW